jgi:hypothetical protein
MLLKNGGFKAASLQPDQALSQGRILLASPFGNIFFWRSCLHESISAYLQPRSFPYVCPQSFLSILEVPRFREPTK